MKRRGFTLVEMLMVITIVAILAVLAVSSYGAARKQAELDIAVDTVVSLMKEQQGLAKSGRVSGESDGDGFANPQALATTDSEKSCYGMRFTTLAKDDETSIEVLKMPYYSYKKGKVDYCDLQAASNDTRDTQREIEIRKIEKFGIDATDLFVVYKPPSGNVVMADNRAADLAPAKYENDALVKVTVGLPNIVDEKVFSIDSITGLTERVYESE